MGNGKLGIHHDDGTVTHTDESIRYAFQKAISFLDAANLGQTANILKDVFEGRTKLPKIEGWTTKELLVPNLGWPDQTFEPLNAQAAEQPDADNPRDIFAAPDRTPKD